MHIIVLVLPLNPDPFPNWLLQLLGANALEGETESHDEPHFYCQGDGIGIIYLYINMQTNDFLLIYTN